MLGLVLTGVLVERSAAQATPRGSAPKTTLTGIFTPAQAARGEETYYGSCVNCHPKGTYAGSSFKGNWNGRPLSDLFDWVLNKMPKNDPGALTPAESVQVVAYILQQNNMPAGKTPLPADMNALANIRIQLK